MHAQYGTLTWEKRKPFWRQCKSLLAKYAVRTGTWEYAGYLNIHHCNKRRLQRLDESMCAQL